MRGEDEGAGGAALLVIGRATPLLDPRRANGLATSARYSVTAVGRGQGGALLAGRARHVWHAAAPGTRQRRRGRPPDPHPERGQVTLPGSSQAGAALRLAAILRTQQHVPSASSSESGNPGGFTLSCARKDCSLRGSRLRKRRRPDAADGYVCQWLPAQP